MKGAYVSRRRAEEFDALLSAPTATRERAAARGDLPDLLDIVDSLEAVPPVTARPEFVLDLRSRLVVEAARLSRPVDHEVRVRLTPRQRQGARERRAATILGGFAIVAATGSMAMASQSALPGDVLYPVKRAIENAETNLQSDDAAKARALLEHAEKRLAEAEQLTASGADAKTVATTLQDFTDQSNQAAELALDDYSETGRKDSVGDLRSFAEKSMDELAKLGDAVPADARPALITAAQSVRQADSAAFQLCPTCGTTDGVTELPEFATKPVSLARSLEGLLSLEHTPLTIDGIDIDTAEVEKLAEREGDKAIQQDADGTRSENNGTAPTTPAAPTAPVSPDPGNDDDSGPLQTLGDRIKKGLNDGGQATSSTVNQTLDTVVSGIGELVNGLLGGK